MIVPMKKVCLMVQDKSRKEALEKLREVGVVHLEKTDAPLDADSNALKLKIKVDDAIGLISDFKLPKKKKELDEPDESGKKGRERRQKPIGMHRGRRATDVFGTDDEAPYSIDAVRAPVRPYLPDLMNGYGEERKELKEQNLILSREISRLEGWGDFDPSSIEEISESIPVYFYEISTDVFARFEKDFQYIKVTWDKSMVRVLVFDNKLPDITPFQLPKKRLNEYLQEFEKNSLALNETEKKIKSFADRRPALHKEMEKIHEDLEFETAVAGMNEVEDVANEYKISWLTGFIPKSELEKVKSVAIENGWALSAYDPGPQDAPPTKIKSNPFVRVIHPLLSFLGTVPGYREFDISPSYLFFFSLFFAMILGDAGYGLIVLVLAVLIGVKGKLKKGVFPDIAKLLIFLTLCTIAWGAINGAWFQIPNRNLPQFLKVLIIPIFDNSGPGVVFPFYIRGILEVPFPEMPLKPAWYIQFLCFSLALIQLVWARGKRIIEKLPYLSAVAQFGTLVMMVGLYFLVLQMLLNVKFPDFALYLILAGVGLNLIFAEQNGGNFFKNLGKGFGNFFQLFLKSVSCFADIISYIRLFAVGLAGAMIAQIFNGMAIGDGFGDFGLAFFTKLIGTVLILVIGHGLNLVLTALSIIVHGVRLNLLDMPVII
ncbi:MAG: V-type ATP synthase subunit I [Treponema sp.]|nr:V-type ATP synthase subunit I [Treponema sp.]